MIASSTPVCLDVACAQHTNKNVLEMRCRRLLRRRVARCGLRVGARLYVVWPYVGREGIELLLAEDALDRRDQVHAEHLLIR